MRTGSCHRRDGSRNAVLSILFAVAFFGYGAHWREAPIVQGDSLQYLEAAWDLSDFRIDRLHDRPPGYPLFLVITGSSHEPARALFFASLVLHVASIWLLAALLRAAGLNERWVVIFAALLLLPSYVEPAAHVMTEVLGQFTLVLGFAGLMTWVSRRSRPALALAALAFAFSGLTRPVYQILGPVLGACLLLVPVVFPGLRPARADLVKAAGALTAGTLLIVGGFAWLNYSRFGFFGVSPLLGFHLTTKTILLADRLPDQYAAVREILVRQRDIELVRRGGTHNGSQTVWEARSELSAVTGLSTPELSRHLLHMNLDLARRAPLEYFQEVARSAATYWFPAGGPLAGMESRAVRWLGTGIHVLVIACFFLQLTVLAGLALLNASARLVGRRSAVVDATALQMAAYVLAGAIVFYTMIVTCVIDIGEPRQRRPTDVLIVFMCFLGAHVWIRTLSVMGARASNVLPGSTPRPSPSEEI